MLRSRLSPAADGELGNGALEGVQRAHHSSIAVNHLLQRPRDARGERLELVDNVFARLGRFGDLMISEIRCGERWGGRESNLLYHLREPPRAARIATAQSTLHLLQLRHRLVHRIQPLSPRAQQLFRGCEFRQLPQLPGAACSMLWHICRAGWCRQSACMRAHSRLPAS